MPVVSGRHLLLPRVCRMPFEGRTVERHTVEIRDANHGRRLGQASLPPVDAPATPMRVGGLLGGPYPLYVWSGGVALVHAGVRKLELALQPEHGVIAGFARGGEILAVAERQPPEAHFPSGSITWTVLDFGQGIELGSLQIAGSEVLAMGVEPPSAKGVPVWLRLRGKEGPADLVALLDPKGSGEGKPTPTIRPRAVPPANHADVGQSSLTSGPRTADLCPVSSGEDAVLPHAIAVRIGADVQTPSGGSSLIRAPGCLSAVYVDEQKTQAWAWLDESAGKPPALAALRCGAPAVRPTPIPEPTAK